MRYMVIKFESLSGEITSVTVTYDDSATNFPAVIGNPNYDAFLVRAELTDTQVKALKPDTWYDFPKETK